MLKKIFFFMLTLLLLGNINFLYAQENDSDSNNCDGVKLNTNVPFIGGGKDGRCMKEEDAGSAFPAVMGGLSKIVVTVILILSLVLFVAGGVMYSMGGADQNMKSKGKELLMKVIIGIILLGSSGVILHMINPNFFS